MKVILGGMFMNKTLVAYFSASGVTKNLAQKISDVLGADLFEIKPAVPYSNEDLDWTNRNSRSSIEMKDKDSRVEIAEKISDMDKYETIYLGFPIWWYVAPHIINSFLEQYDFANKKINVFATSGGSDLGNTIDELKTSAPNAIWGKSKGFSAMANENDIASWINQAR